MRQKEGGNTDALRPDADMGLLPYVAGYRAGFKAASAADGTNGKGYDAAVSHHEALPCAECHTRCRLPLSTQPAAPLRHAARKIPGPHDSVFLIPSKLSRRMLRDDEVVHQPPLSPPHPPHPVFASLPSFPPLVADPLSLSPAVPDRDAGWDARSTEQAQLPGLCTPPPPPPPAPCMPPSPLSSLPHLCHSTPCASSDPPPPRARSSAPLPRARTLPLPSPPHLFP